MKLLEELTQAVAPSGHEKPIRQIIRREIEGYADEIKMDALGNLIAVKYGQGEDRKKIMFAAHMDEIGYQVMKIEPDGRLRVCNVGWVWTGAAYNARVQFQNGTKGVVGCLSSIEDAHNDPTKMYIDIGATSKEDAEKYVKIGDTCGFFGPYMELANDRITCKTIDDRVGVYMLIEALKQNPGTYPNDVYYVFTVQEEVGCRGSKVTADWIRPDVGIAVDISPAHDYPCDLEGSNTVGAGIAIKISDPSVICNDTVIDTMITCCDENQIPYQRDVIYKGGTDASSMNLSNDGVRAGGISVVLRNPHSQSAICDKKDIQAGVDLCAKLPSYVFDFSKEE